MVIEEVNVGMTAVNDSLAEFAIHVGIPSFEIHSALVPCRCDVISKLD
jgi:hypothetical protein